jgi:hypothetical protein
MRFVSRVCVPCLLKKAVPSLVVSGILLATTGVSPSVAAPGDPQGPGRITQPPTTKVTIFPTPTPPTPPHAENPVLTLPNGTTPKVRIPIVPSVAAVTDAARDEIDVYAIDTRGALDVIRKIPDHILKPNNFPPEPDGFWGPIGNIAGQPIFVPGAPVTAIYHPTSQETLIFAVDASGTLQVVRHLQQAPIWDGPRPLTGAGFAQPGAPVAAIWQPLNDQVEAYVMGTNGAVMGVWNANNGPWNPPFNLSGPGFAPNNAMLAPVWEPNNELLGIFVLDQNGALNFILKTHDGAWDAPKAITRAGYAALGAPVAAVWEATNDPLQGSIDIFTVDRNGTARVISRKYDQFKFVVGSWPAPTQLFAFSQLPPNAAITAGWSDTRGSPVVAVVDLAGAVHQMTKFRGEWLSGDDPIASAGFAPAGAQLAFTSNGAGIFGVDLSNTIRMVSNDKAGTALTRPNYNPIYGSHAAYCSDVLRHYSSTTSDSSFTDCTDFMGLTKFCADHGAHVMVDYSGDKAILNCQDDYHPDSLWFQYKEIGLYIGNAFVAVMPMIGAAADTIGCAELVVFACVGLAVDIAGNVDELAGGSEVAGAVLNAKDCAEDDIIACAELGATGSKAAAGLIIPGENQQTTDNDKARCQAGEFAACMRLGEESVGAGGVPYDPQLRKDADACANADFSACISLGKRAVDLGVPLGGVPNAAENLKGCKMGDLSACSQLGQALARLPR